MALNWFVRRGESPIYHVPIWVIFACLDKNIVKLNCFLIKFQAIEPRIWGMGNKRWQGFKPFSLPFWLRLCEFLHSGFYFLTKVTHQREGGREKVAWMSRNIKCYWHLNICPEIRLFFSHTSLYVPGHLAYVLWLKTKPLHQPRVSQLFVLERGFLFCYRAGIVYLHNEGFPPLPPPLQ